jgi:hypothetical protein
MAKSLEELSLQERLQEAGKEISVILQKYELTLTTQCIPFLTSKQKQPVDRKSNETDSKE